MLRIPDKVSDLGLPNSKPLNSVITSLSYQHAVRENDALSNIGEKSKKVVSKKDISDIKFIISIVLMISVGKGNFNECCMC